MALNFLLPVRIAQVVFAIIVLGLTAYGVDLIWGSSSRVNFLLFTSIWTLLATAYLIITPGRYPNAAHKYGVLGVEFLTMIFWFAGFIALAVVLPDAPCGRSTFCGSLKAAAVFGAFEWLLFALTTGMAALHCWRTRDSYDKRPDPQMQVNGSV